MKRLVFVLTVIIAILVLPKWEHQPSGMQVLDNVHDWPHLDRNGHYGDSSRMYMKLWQRAGVSRDSAAYYVAKWRYHRDMESLRQHVVKDSGWRAQLEKFQKAQFEHSGTQGASPLNGGALRNSARFLNNNDKFSFCPGEYVPMDVDITAGIFYSHAGSAVPATIPSAPSNAAVAIGGPHNACGLTSNGGLYCYGGWVPDGTHYNSGSGSMIQIITDSLGHTLDPVAQGILSGTGQGTFWNMAFVTTTGKLYVAGELEAGLEGNNTWGCPASTKPVQVTATGNPFFTKVQGGYIFIALDSAGNVWDWGGGGYNYWLGQGNSPANYKVPTKINLPVGYRAIDIASNGTFSYILCRDTNGNMHIFMCAQQYYEDTVGIYPTGTVTTSFQEITSYLTPYWAADAGHQPAHIYVSCNSSYVIMDNGWLFGWGGSPCGEMGTGLQLNWWANGPFFWNFGPHQCQQLHPIRIAPGVRNFKTINTCLSNSFYVEFEDSTGQIYSCGRNKGQAQVISLPKDSSTSIACARYIQNDIATDWPDSWEEGHLRWLHIGHVSQNLQVTSPYCDSFPTANVCSLFVSPTHKPSGGSLTGAYQNGYIVVSAAGKTSGNTYIRFLWQQGDSTTAPSLLDLGTAAEVTDTIRTSKDVTITNGTYHILWTGVTNGNDTARDSITVSVNVAPPPTVNAGSNQSVITTITTLVGTATGNGGATITSTLWTQVSGPNSSNILTPNNLTTNVTGLAQGTYVFKLSATDSNNNTSTATVQVTVAFIAGNYLLHRKGRQVVW